MKEEIRQSIQPIQQFVGSSLISHEQPKGTPIGVKIISVLFYILAVLFIILGILSFLAIFLISSLADVLEGGPLEGFTTLGIVLFIILGTLLVGLGIFEFFIARGLWKLKKWARITTIILSIISILLWVVSLFTTGFSISFLVSPVVSIIILLYLIFSRKVKEAFV